MKRPLNIALLVAALTLGLVALLYAALSSGANPAVAIDAETRQTILDMRVGEMRKMKILSKPAKMILIQKGHFNIIQAKQI